MKVLFIAPRFHTNQYTLLKKIKEKGNNVYFFAFSSEHSENHSDTKPTIIETKERNKETCILPVTYFLLIYKIKPDIIIVRHKNFSTIINSIILRSIGFTVIGYVQIPKFGKKMKFFSRLYLRMLSSTIITPVQGDAALVDKNDIMFGQKWDYIPFVAQHSNQKRDYFQNNKINILVVGKYTKRKKIIEFLGIFEDIDREYKNLQLTIVGTILDKEIYDKIITISSKMENVTIMSNIDHGKMEELYTQNDIFILPSINEPASYSQLEAMGQGLAVICSDDNGTSNYILNGINGYVFNSNNFEKDLKSKLTSLLHNKGKIVNMGQKGIELIEKNHSIDRYYDFLLDACLKRKRFKKCLKNMKGRL